jgi:hypothetical protein
MKKTKKINLLNKVIVERTRESIKDQPIIKPTNILSNELAKKLTNKRINKATM